MQFMTNLVERGLLPDGLTRLGIRRLLAERADHQRPASCEARGVAIGRLVDAMHEGPIAVATADANQQHYELPTGFFQQVLGPQLKYSCCLWEPGTRALDRAEEDMLSLSCERADLSDGQSILELGCGWGALTLWMAEKYPGSRITALSNSSSQREFIESRARERGLDNVRIITADINNFRTDEQFDRVVSLEMFEHMRNWGELTRWVGAWLKPGGKLFIHIFCHRDFPYFFETDGDKDWMARYFFTGGLMPSDDLPARFQSHFALEHQWRANGHHYARTCRAWLDNQDRNRKTIMPIMEATYGKEQAGIWFNRWRMFFMACEEFFGFRNGEEWWVSHYRFRKPG